MLKSFNSSMIIPPMRPIISPIYWDAKSLVLKMIATSKKVISGVSVVMITPPFPAKPYFTPKKEKIINATYATPKSIDQSVKGIAKEVKAGPGFNKKKAAIAKMICPISFWREVNPRLRFRTTLFLI